MPIQKKLFHLRENSIDRVLLVDNSNSEEGITLDEEDLGFLKKDVECIEKENAGDVVEITIEPKQPASSKADGPQDQLNEDVRPSTSSLEFK